MQQSYIPVIVWCHVQSQSKLFILYVHTWLYLHFFLWQNMTAIYVELHVLIQNYLGSACFASSLAIPLNNRRAIYPRDSSIPRTSLHHSQTWYNNTIQSRCNTANLLTNIHNRRPIPQPSPDPTSPFIHWGWHKMADISQTIFSNVFSWMKTFEL